MSPSRSPASPVRRVRVETTARLHLGFIDLTRRRSRQFGSLGLALAAPATTVTVSAGGTAAPLPAEVADTVRAAAEHFGVEMPTAVTVDEAIPRHAGLGSGTQRALAVAAAVAGLSGRDPDARELAAATGRGRRSGIGIGTYRAGGFVVDGGRSAAANSPPVIARVAFPEPWRVVLLTDPDFEGLSGSSENAAFDSLPGMATTVANELAYLTLMGILPALHEHDFLTFARAVGRIQTANGDHFASAQNGRYASAKVAEAIALLSEAGHVGLGQSSWGPTGFVFAPDAMTAEEVAALVEARFACGELVPRIARARNEGAKIERDSHAAAGPAEADWPEAAGTRSA
mgnify:CR=1 FL=1